jgi:hypothetical protein
MILRPVSPVSAFGPPTVNRPVGLISTSNGPWRRCSGIPLDDLPAQFGAQGLGVDVLGVLGRQHDLLHRHWHPVGSAP